MITKVVMPKFGLSMEEGTIGSWMVAEGDAVQKGGELAEVSSEKITNTVECPADGVLRKILVEEDGTVPCGAVICLIADSMSEDISGVGAGASPASQVLEETAAPVVAVEAVPAADVRITPRAKKIAQEKGLSYAHIVGTGLLGAITIDDLKKHGKPLTQVVAPVAAPVVPAVVAPVAPVAASAPVAPAAPKHFAVYNTTPCGEEDVIVKMNPMQQAICKAMTSSLQTAAQITIATEADISPLVEIYKQIKGKYKNAGVKLSYTAMIIKSVAQALENHPKLRTSMVDETHLKTSARVNVGCAVDIPNGLVVPVIRDANLKDLRTICLELADLTEKAKSGRLVAEDMGDASITITNLGMFGITYFTPIINAPEGSILGVGAILEKLLVKNGGFFPGSVLNLSLTHDHRFVDGAPAARFLQEVVCGLQEFKWL